MQWFLGHYDFFKNFAAPIATIVAALTAAGITWHFGRVQADISRQQAALSKQQAILASTRLQYDLFAKRFEVYEATFYYLSNIVGKGITEDVALTFGLAANSAGFLFGNELKNYLFGYMIKAQQLQAIREMLSKFQDGPERDDLLQKEKEIYSWFASEIPMMPLQFMPYLHLPHRIDTAAEIGAPLVADLEERLAKMNAELHGRPHNAAAPSG